jgi:hypothetical protein
MFNVFRDDQIKNIRYVAHELIKQACSGAIAPSFADGLDGTNESLVPSELKSAAPTMLDSEALREQNLHILRVRLRCCGDFFF